MRQQHMARHQARRQQGQNTPASHRSSPLQRLHLHAAGIDVGATQHWVAAPEDRDPEPVRLFGAFTADLYAVAEWLWQCRITTVTVGFVRLRRAVYGTIVRERDQVTYQRPGTQRYKDAFEYLDLLLLAQTMLPEGETLHQGMFR